ncbi:MAG TPA: hypothetical protein VH247_04870 [Thermoleophilaceae bacterium]|jgi:hypothetical protein|nr:hypothetical protein [Thermoleophilaceae bacterium]
MYRGTRLIAVISVVAAVAVAGCGSAKQSAQSAPNPNAQENSPPGDIPDNTAFVRFKLPGAGFSVKVPEGWARTGAGSRLTFTSNLNSVTVESGKANGTLTPAAVKSGDVAALARSERGFKLASVVPIHRSGQGAIRVRYDAKGKASQVTGKTVTDTVERYLFDNNGREAILTLAGPKGADNVDAWRTISDSLRWGA